MGPETSRGVSSCWPLWRARTVRSKAMSDELNQVRAGRGSTALRIVVVLIILLTAAWFLCQRLVIADKFLGL